MTSDTAFMQFWKTINGILKSRGLPEMLYGEARGWFDQHQEELRVAVIKERCDAIAKAA